jgi:hypothetical protein
VLSVAKDLATDYTEEYGVAQIFPISYALSAYDNS